MKIQELKTLMIIICIALSGCHQNSKTPDDKVPNIVFILADDMGYGDASCYNPESKIETLGSLMQKSGYKTACIGKWHVGMNWQTKGDYVIQDDESKWSFIGR